MVPESRQPTPSRTVEDQVDLQKLFNDWSKTAEGAAALFLDSANKRPAGRQPQQVGKTGYDGIDEYLSELSHTENNTRRRGPVQTTPRPTAVSAAASSGRSDNRKTSTAQPMPAEAVNKNALKEYLGALGEMSQKNRSNAKPRQTTPAPPMMRAQMKELLRRQRGLSSSSGASPHSSYTQNSHNRQHSGASSNGTPSQMPAQSSMARPSAAPVVPTMGSSNVDDSGDFSVQSQPRAVSRDPEIYTSAQKMQWPQWSNGAGGPAQHSMAGYHNPPQHSMSGYNNPSQHATFGYHDPYPATISNPFAAVPHVVRHPGSGVPVQAMGMSSLSSQGLSPHLLQQQAMSMPMQSPNMAHHVQNASSQGSAPQQRPVSAGGQMRGHTGMPPPAGPVRLAGRVLEDPMAQVRRDSILSAQGLMTGANTPRLHGQHPQQYSQQHRQQGSRGFSTSPMSMQTGGMPVSNVMLANGMPTQAMQHVRPFTTPANGGFIQVRQPSVPPQGSPMQQQEHIMHGNGQIARTPPQIDYHQPLPSTPHRSTPAHPQQQRTPQFVPAETLRARAGSLAAKSPRSAVSNASPRVDNEGHFHFPGCGCDFCRNATNDGDAAAGGFI